MDATFSKSLGKSVNDSVKGNCVIKPVYLRKKLHLCLFALEEIVDGTELRYSYGVSGLSWRKV